MFNELVTELKGKMEVSEVHISTMADRILANLTLDEIETALTESGGMKPKRIAKFVAQAKLTDEERINRPFAETVSGLRGRLSTILAARVQQQ